eukprot:3538847-Rhodomonas_salina.1
MRLQRLAPGRAALHMPETTREECWFGVGPGLADGATMLRGHQAYTGLSRSEEERNVLVDD